MTAGNPIECIQQANAILGEGPVWDWRSGDLYWVDIRRMQVFRHHLASGRQTGQWAFPERVGCIALTADPGRIVVAAGLRVHLLDLATGAASVLADLGGDRLVHRCNDGAVDAGGRLWVGTMMDDFHNPERFAGGGLHRIEADGSVASWGSGLQLPNGIGWSPDGTRMYLNDSAAGITYAFDFDPKSGTPSGQRPLLTFGPADGLPDGLAVDADGNIWCAMWDGWCIRKHAPDGTLLARLEMPVRRPSSATLGGPDLDQLIVTSATVGFTSADYAKSPQAGGLFRLKAGARGQRPNLFGAPTPLAPTDNSASRP